MTQPVQDKIWLTQEQFDTLQAELDQLSGPGRKEITQRIPPPAPRVTSRRTAATTPPARSRARPRPASASSRT